MVDLPLGVDSPAGRFQVAGLPLHRQVYEAVREAILSGRLRPGDRLPASRALAEQLSLSRTTVSAAYDQLRAEGYLLGRHGSGTYVAPSLPADALDGGPGGAAPDGFLRPVRLSDWGRRISAPNYTSLLRTGRGVSFAYDFQPHRVAEDSFPMEDWRAAVNHALTGDRAAHLFYPPSAGHPELRAAIAAHVRRYRAVTCGGDQVVIVNGSQQGLNLLAQLTLDPGAHVAVEDPGYPAARLALEAQGLQVSRIPVDNEGMIVERLETAGPHHLVHVTPSHQDPTGATMSLARRLALLDLAERVDCIVVEDDYDSEFRYEGRPVESLQGLDRHGLVVYAGTFSKSILAGLRIGFLVLPTHLVEPFVTAKSLWDGGTAMLEQAALAEFLHSGDFERHIRRMRRLYATRRNALVGALLDVFGARAAIGQRQGGLNMLVTLDVPLSEEEVMERAASAGIGLRAASPYYAVPPPQPTFLMGFGAMPEEEIREGIRLLGTVLR